MLQTFFEKPLDGKDTSYYFKKLKIWQQGEKYIAEQGKYPVIFLSFRGVKFSTLEKTITNIKTNITLPKSVSSCG